jgi:hypothetical protein
MEKHEAIDKLKRQRRALEEMNVVSVSTSSAEFKKWQRDTEILIRYAFGEYSRHVEEFTSIGFTPLVVSLGGDNTRAFASAFRRGKTSALACLASMIDEVEEYWPESSEKAQAFDVSAIQHLIMEIEEQKSLMIAVATGGPRIQDVNDQYRQRRLTIKSILLDLGIADPNPFGDLWEWYGKWSDGSLPSYQSRRQYVSALYAPLLETLAVSAQRSAIVQPADPSGWPRVDRGMEKVISVLESARDEEDYQSIGFLCREVLISVAQAVYDPDLHPPVDDIVPSKTDAKRMLESFIAKELSGQTNEYHRHYAKSACRLADHVQHRRTADFRTAALCAEATRAVVNMTAIMSGQRDPSVG